MQNKNSVERVRKKKSIIFKTIVFILILSLSVLFALNSSIFNIKTVKINKTKTLTQEDVLKNSKIVKSSNIFKLRLGEVEKNILLNPFVKTAKVRRVLPNHIDIKLEEREKTFLIEYNSMLLVADEEGYIMEKVESIDENLALVRGFNTESSEPGFNIFKKEDNENLKTFINEAKNLKILSEMSEIDKDFSNDVNIKLKNGISVAFGTLNNVKYKLSLLKEIMEDINKREIKSGKIIMNEGSNPRLVIGD